MTATQTRSRRSNRTARSAELNEQQQTPKLAAVPTPAETPVPQATPKPKPEPKPLAKVELGARPVTYWFPTATLADGSQVACGHSKYGHESEKSAQRCINALVASRGHRVS